LNRIDVLPDDVLLKIFGFYVKTDALYVDKRETEQWQLLVHVCRRWRSLVLGSPRGLNLQLYCTLKTPIRDRLDVWPALPLLIVGNMALTPGVDNVIAALGQSNCVSRVILSDVADWQLEKVLAAMQVSFPELTDLRLSSHVKTLSVIPVPNSFLGGSAPRLQYFELSGIPFPRLPKLLLSATHLVSLKLSNIPHSGYISPEAIVAPSPCCPASEYFAFNSDPLNLALTGKAEVCFPQNVLSCPLSIIFFTRGLSNI
jgi:hypothetical protein